MTLLKNIIGFSFSKRCFNLLAASVFMLNAYSQEDKKSEDWWIEITNRLDIKFDSYTLHENCFIVGNKENEGEMETFKDVIVISIESEDYWIFKSKTGSYEPSTRILKINDCTMEQFKKNSKSLEPEQSFKHINYTINYEKNISTMATIRPDGEIEDVINKLFGEIIIAGEQLDFDKMKMQVNDKFSSGFINDGKYYKSFDILFDDYKKTTNGIKSQKLTIDNKKITILSENSVLLTANGQFSATTDTGNILNGKFAWTIIYEKIDNEWKITHTNMTNTR